MTDVKFHSVTRIVAIAALLISAAAGAGKGETMPAHEDREETHQAGAVELFLAEGAADGGTLLMAANDTGGEDRQELKELLAILNEESAVATKTKMNSDYVPGMVTVLHGDQFEAFGLHTVADALAMVPGIQSSRLETGEPSIKVRGLAFAFNAGNIKVMLNSIALSRESSGINSSVLLIPLSQVDRIEVIRGPGSSIYGDFAMAGVVNIITKDSGSRLFGRTGGDDAIGGGGYYNYRDDVHDITLGVNISAMDDGKNAARQGLIPDEKQYSGVFNFGYQNFSFTVEGVRRRIDCRIDTSIGPLGFNIPPFRSEESWVMEARQTLELKSNITLDAHLSFLQNDYDSIGPTKGFQGNRVETGIDLNWLLHDRHQLLLSVSYADSDINDAFNVRPLEIDTIRISGIERKNYSVGLQDQVMFTDRFSMTYGIRFDEYDDVVENLLTPRIAAVYRLGEHHVVKAQYSEGFRAPTFWELYQTGRADEHLDFEVLDMTEFSYIYRRPNIVGRATFYYSEINNGIIGSLESHRHENTYSAHAKGVEVEWEQRIGEKLRWQANLSYNDTRNNLQSDTQNNRSLGIASWLGNLALIVQPTAKITLAGHLLHVGDRYALGDRDPIEGYDTVDLTVTHMDFWKTGIILRGGVKDLFDDDIVYIVNRPHGLDEQLYYGRTWWLQLSYDFQ